MPDDETTEPEPAAVDEADAELEALAAEADPKAEVEVVEPEAPDEAPPEDVPGEVGEVEVAEAATAEEQLSPTDFESYLDEQGNWVTPELVAYENQAWLAQVQAYERATGSTLFEPAVAPADPDAGTIDEAYPTPPAEEPVVAPEGS